jgi:hypothetical protein
MEHYVGLDVGLEETSLCIVDNEGKTVREVKVSTEPVAIRSALEGFADRLSRIGVSLVAGHMVAPQTASERAADHCCGSPPHAGVAVEDAQQDRPKRCAGYCTNDATGLVPRCPCQEHRDAKDAHTFDQPHF